MKRILCGLILCVFCLAACGAYAPCRAEDWTLFESCFGFTLWYRENQLSFWEDEFEGEEAECFCPLEDQSGVAVLICAGSIPSDELWSGQTPVSLDETEAALEYPYEVTAYTDGDVLSEQWIVSAPDGDYVFVIQYEEGDYQGWAPLFHDVLETLEFPNQPAENDSFRLVFFEGGAAGMRFTDVVVDEEAEPMVLMPLTEVKDFALESVEWEDWDPSFSALYTASVLSPGDNLLIYCYIPDMLPNLCFRYIDGAGEEECWYISQSGRDGSLLLIPQDDL